MTPYEIRLYSTSGSQILKVTRENDFITEPRVEGSGGSISYMGGFSGSSAIIVIAGGRFLNVVRIWDPAPTQAKTIVDVFDRDGVLLTSIKETRDLDLKRGDEFGALYGFDKTEFPRMVRFRLVLE
jgi:hypothetical protein